MFNNEVWQKNTEAILWKRYCGFLSLSVNEFMEIQDRLLNEEIELVAQSYLGKKIMMGAMPGTTKQFRELVPLTSYDDYASYLSNQQEDVLSQKPDCWARTSGRGGKPKWVPYTERAIDWIGRIGVATLILACASKEGEVRIGKSTRLMQNLPSRPYYSGVGTFALLRHLPLVMIPPIEKYENEPFEKKVADSFKLALRSGVDVLGSLTTVLVKMGERFTENSGQIAMSWQLLHPKILSRLFLALLKSKIEKRSLLPKDLWPLKGLICYGMDTEIYRDQLVYYWGKEPLEIYGGTEMGLIATTAWNKKWMTFIPFFSFLEFIPEEEWLKNRSNNNYQPSTVLLNEVEVGKRYELVITNFYGMPFLRYRIGDLIKIVALEDKETGIKIPQLVFDSRADDLIDLGGFTRLDEKTIWYAVNNTKIKYEDWLIRKEYIGEHSVLHLYIEPKEKVGKGEIENLVHNELLLIDKDYKDLENVLGVKVLEVSILSDGTFQRYYRAQQNAGVDLAHTKPPHMNASENVLQELLRCSESQK